MATGLLITVPTGAVAEPAPTAASVTGGALPTQTTQLPTHDRSVSTVPAAWTPQILNGRTYDITQTGNTMVVGGDFSSIAPASGSPTLNRSNVFAFDATSGAINTSFAPSVNGAVRAVEPGPTASTVYIGGSFQGVNGVTTRVALLDLSNGQVVSSFSAPSMNGVVQDLQRVGDRLIVGGYFSSVGGREHRGLVSLDAHTGARQDFLQVQLTENHNYTGQPGQARAGVGAKSLSVTPDGTQLAVIGNFRKADGLDRRQMVVVDLSGDTAQVRDDWRTRRYEPACFSNAFDTYVRDVDVAPDGSYFVVATTGGPNPGTLCDTITRWDVDDTGDRVEPVWIDDTGGDTLLSAASSGAAVYTGGHQRWHNNHGGRDFPAPGAVGRPGMAAVDVDNGIPMAWNPGRSPRGVGAEAMYVTEAGLWMGSDTEQIGHHQYRRPRLAFFPVAGGKVQRPGDTGTLPSNVYVASTVADTAAGEPLFRVNAGGPELPALDGGPVWAADQGTSSPWRNSGSNAAGWPAGIPNSDGTVPATTPTAIYDSERWDPADNPEMSWAIPVPAGEDVRVRLYLANRCECTQTVGARVFTVRLEGTAVLTDHDIVADVGHDVATVKSFDITSDGTVNIDFEHVTENPLVNGIEILAIDPDADPAPPTPGLSRVWYEGAHVVAPPTDAPTGGVDWAQVRGAVVIDGDLFYGTSDGTFWRRSFDGTTYGPASEVDPYNDPYWSTISTGSGGYTYRGVRPSFYGQIPSLTGMAYDDGRLYYTRAGANRLYSREFLPDSGVMSQAVREVPDFMPSNLGGVFLDPTGDFLYYSNTANGTLSRISWADGTVQGSAVVVSGPDIDGMDWRGRALFLADGPQPPANQPPEPVIDADCFRLDCTFDSSGSTDPDGEIISRTWDLGDGSTSDDASLPHSYTEEGEYTVTLTVTDDRGAVATATFLVEAYENRPPVAVAGEPVCSGLECDFDASGSSDPDPGDSIAEYAWDFGDDSPSESGETVTHTFPEAGTYSVTLTVTDQEGATANHVIEVTVRELGQAPDLVGHAGTSAHALTAQVQVPHEVEAGDLLLLFVTASAADELVGPSGAGSWEQVTRVESGPMPVTVYGKLADGSEAGTNVTMSLPRLFKTDLVLAAYRGTGGTDLVEVVESAVAASTDTHTTPVADVPGEGRTVLSFWAERSSSVTEWAAPDGVTVVSAQTGTGGGRVGSLLAEAQPGAGPYGGLIAQTDSVSARSAGLTLVLAPDDGASAEPPENTAPVAVIGEPTCAGLECSFDGSGSYDADGDALEFVWDFGGGETATGASITHTFAEAGSYPVSLTVTDEHDATGSASVVVEVSAPSDPDPDPDPDPAGAPALVGHSAVNGHVLAPKVSIPGDVEDGDLLLLFVTVGGAVELDGPTGGSGWEEVTTVSSGPLTVTVFAALAAESDADETVTVGLSSLVKSDLVAVAYRGVAADDPIEALETAVAASTTEHASPVVTIPGESRTALSFWAERSSSTTEWTAPDGVTVVSAQAGVGGGRVGSLLAESRPEAGDYGDLVARTDTTSARRAALTLVLAPGEVTP